MTQSILTVDFGAYETTAALVTADQIRLVPCPATGGAGWPGAQRLDLDLSIICTEAERLFQTRPDRLALTVPTSVTSALPAALPDPRRELLIECAGRLGYPDVELVGDGVAAVCDPFTRPELPDHSLVLVCDLGVTWSVTLLRMNPAQPVPLACELAGEGLTRAGLDHSLEPALRWVLASCRAIAARAGVPLSEVSRLVVAGGSARMAHVGDFLRQNFETPVWTPAHPELAVIRGAAAWAAQVPSRRVAATAATWRMEPLAWEIPDDRARVVRWTVPSGQSYPAGATLAQVRTLDDRVFDLTAPRAGILVEHKVAVGGFLHSGAVAAMARSAKVISGDRLTKRLQMKVTGDWMLTPDRQHVVECADNGAYVRLRSIATGSVVEEVRPGQARHEQRFGRVFVHPDGRMALVCWDVEGQFAVWDVPSGRLTAQFRASARPMSVLVNEAQWRLVSEVDRQVHVGRYRRDTATVWDLGTGAVVEEMVGEDLQRRFTGYSDRSPNHGFAAEMRSPDGTLRVTAKSGAPGSALLLHQTDTDEELFRTDIATARSLRTAFSADGHYLLARWRAAELSCLDVWQM